MSAYEQRVEPPDKAFQYVVFAAEPRTRTSRLRSLTWRFLTRG